MKKIFLSAIFILTSFNFVFAQEEKPVTSFVTNSAILTNDMEKTLHFYTELMGFKVLSQSEIKDGKSKDILGIKAGVPTNLTYLVPSNAVEGSFAGGMAVIEVGGNGQGSYKRSDNKGSAMYGEIAMVHRVGNIQQIYKNMTEAGVTIVTPLSPSATGKSMSFSALDPNGVRHEMYEMIPE